MEVTKRRRLNEVTKRRRLAFVIEGWMNDVDWAKFESLKLN